MVRNLTAFTVKLPCGDRFRWFTIWSPCIRVFPEYILSIVIVRSRRRDIVSSEDLSSRLAFGLQNLIGEPLTSATYIADCMHDIISMCRPTHKHSATRREGDERAHHVRAKRRYVLRVRPVDRDVHHIPDDEAHVYDDVKELAARVYGIGRATCYIGVRLLLASYTIARA